MSRRQKLLLSMLGSFLLHCLLAVILFSGVMVPTMRATIDGEAVEEPEEVVIPGWPWVPALFLISVGGVTVFAIVREPLASRYGLLTIAVGLIAWWLQMRLGGGTGRSRNLPE